MKSLIRFEDTYGIADIFCARKNIPYLDISKTHLRMIELDSDTFVDFGLGAGWARVTTDEVYSIIERGIERIILVYDMDNETGDKAKILSKECLSNRINDLYEQFRKVGYNIEICCIPTVYSAETIMLHQFIEGNGEDITSLVNTQNTNDFHLCLIAYFINANNIKHAKIVRNYLDINILLDAFRNTSDKDLNKDLKDWILKGCKADTVTASSSDALVHIDKVKRFFEKYMRDNKNSSYTIKNKIVSFNASRNTLIYQLGL